MTVDMSCFDEVISPMFSDEIIKEGVLLIEKRLLLWYNQIIDFNIAKLITSIVLIRGDAV